MTVANADMSPDALASGTPAISVRPGLAFELAALDRWMAGNVRDYRGPLEVEQFAGGQSNPTYKLQTATKAFALRRKPAGQLLKGAHAIDREARVMAALRPTGFPVPEVYASCADESVIGTPFYVMEMVEGRVFWDATFPGVPAADRPLYFEAMNGALARLHSFDPGNIGLSDYGRTGNYFARQISRWTSQYLEDRLAGPDANMDRLVEWLPRNIPPGNEAAIVHGDFRCDNMIFHPTEPRLLAVIDWELSTLGHPLADFAYNAIMYRMPPHLVAGFAGADLRALNIPSEAQYVSAYCDKTGRNGIADYDFYIAFSFFRLAAIFHGIRGRFLRGTASSAQAEDHAANFPELAALAWSQI